VSLKDLALAIDGAASLDLVVWGYSDQAIKADYRGFRARNAKTYAGFGSRTPVNDRPVLTASAEERARRRYKQLKEKGLGVTLAALLREIQARDVRDAGRAVAPLRPAADAVLIDSTGMPIEAVVNTVLALVTPAHTGDVRHAKK